MLWLGEAPLVLASRSGIRRELLEKSGVPVEVKPADIDERGIEAKALLQTPVAVSALLARKKAETVARMMPGRLVLGADQILSLKSVQFSKPVNRAAARAQLAQLGGQTHELYSAVTFALNDNILLEHVGIARLTMRALSEQFIDDYLDSVGDAAIASVGAYQLEGLGIQLFERVDGDYFTILGLPLIVVLHFLRDRGCLAQ